MFPVSVRIKLPPDVGIDELRSLAFGQRTDRRVPRGRAVLALASTDPGAGDALGEIAGDEAVPDDVRRVAVGALARLGTQDAVHSLERAAGSDNALVAASAVKALGRVGTPASLPMVVAAERRLGGRSADRAAVAAALIAHRHGLDGPDLPHLPASALLDPPDLETESGGAQPVAAERARAAVSDIGSRPFGVGVLAERSYQLPGVRERLVLLNEEIGNDLSVLGERRWILAVVATWFDDRPGFGPSHAILTSPSTPGHLDVGVVRSTGLQELRGTGRLTGGRVTVDLRAVARPGAAAVLLQLAIDADGLEVLGYAATREAVVPKLVPRPVT